MLQRECSINKTECIRKAAVSAPLSCGNSYAESAARLARLDMYPMSIEMPRTHCSR